MTLRDYRFLGQVYSDTGSAELIAKFNNKEVFSGVVAADTSSVPTRLTGELDVLFECTEDVGVTGNVPLEISVTGGILFFGAIQAKYYLESGETFWDDVNNNSFETDGKTNAKINGIEQVRQVLDPEDIGEWLYKIPDNSVFTCDIYVDPDLIDAGSENTEPE